VPRIQLIVIFLAVAGLLLSIWLFRTSESAVAAREREVRQSELVLPEVSGPARAASGLQIDTWTVRSASVRQAAQVAAVLKPARSVVVGAEVGGRVLEVVAVEHSEIEAGAPILRLEPGFLEAAQGRAEGALMRARANYGLARLELDRQRDLATQQVASAAELDRALSAEQARAADVREAEAVLADARLRLSKSEITAPFAGVVMELDLEPGAYLRVGEPVARVLDLSHIEVEVGLTDREIVALRKGDRVALQLEVFPAESFPGTVTAVGRAAESQSQKYPVEVQIPNSDRRLLPGMLGRVEFEIGEGRSAIRVPRRATQSEFELSYVFVIVDDGGQTVVERRRIAARPVPFRPDLLEVVGGLEEGEQIAVSRIRDLRDGLPVRVSGTSL
jgi:membrane fusion protein (multidrug efflux system)